MVDITLHHCTKIPTSCEKNFNETLNLNTYLDVYNVVLIGLRSVDGHMVTDTLYSYQRQLVFNS